MSHKKILAFAGSTSQKSLNKILLKYAILMARSNGLQVTEIDLKDYPLPLYQADKEAQKGLPPAAQALKEIFQDHEALLIASPEYNSSITPLLKNTIDWVSRKAYPDEPDLQAYRYKKAALLSASPGYYGGLRGLVTVRSILNNIGVTVIPEQVCVPNAHQILAQKDLFDQKYQQKIKQLCESLARHLG